MFLVCAELMNVRLRWKKFKASLSLGQKNKERLALYFITLYLLNTVLISLFLEACDTLRKSDARVKDKGGEEES